MKSGTGAALLMCLFLSGATLAQPANFSTDSIDFFKPTANSSTEGKSIVLAAAASLLLPGTGHQYLDRNQSALIYFTAEAASVFAWFFSSWYADATARNAAGYAWTHAGATGTIKDADDYRWRVVGNFMDTHEFNNVMDLNRTPEKKITDESLFWYWDDVSSQDRYNQIRTTSRDFRVLSNFFIGAMVLNRVVAFVDIRMTARNKAYRQRPSALFHSLQPLVDATPTSVSIALQGSW